jgi:Uma2 family endonuclease
MNLITKPAMTVDEFLAWAEGREGKFELIGGVVQQMSPERADHNRVKAAAWAILKAAITKGKLPCEALTDGMTVRAGQRRAFVPDAIVHCQPKLDGKSVEVREPVIVVEVLSPSSVDSDSGAKLSGYFGLPSVAHYLIVDVDERNVVHHRRASGEAIETRILTDGVLKLDPPGIEIGIGAFFEDL